MPAIPASVLGLIGRSHGSKTDKVAGDETDYRVFDFGQCRIRLKKRVPASAGIF